MKENIETTEKILRKAHKEKRSTLFEHEVYGILKGMGIRTPVHIFIRDVNEITSNTLSLFSSEKIVLKVQSVGIPHKQKAGGVKSVYKDLDFVKYTFSRMKEEVGRQYDDIEGILLCEHIEYSKDLGNEILLGIRESEAFGPLISFSKGGTDAEHFAGNFSPPNLILAPIDRKWHRE